MRPIKFRAFDKEAKTMHKVSVIDFDMKQVMLEEDNGDYFHKSFDEIELMQFTGLHDKNGKEIYEGDILKYSNNQIFIVKFGNCKTQHDNLGSLFYLDGTGLGINKHHDCNVLYPIKEQNNKAFLYEMSSDWHSTFERYNEVWGLEIIGNIHENPELLKNETP